MQEKSRNIDSDIYYTERKDESKLKFQINSFNENRNKILDFSIRKDSETILNPSNILLKSIIKENKNKTEAIYSKIRKHSLK